MTRYIIAMTITPDPPTAAPASQMTVRVDTSSGRPRVNELIVRSDDDRGLASADLPAIDLSLLIQALSGGLAAALAGAAELPGPKRPARSGAAGGASSRGRRTARASAPAAGKKASVSRSQARRAAKSASRRGISSGTNGERAYRRMPDPSEVLAAYERVGTITGLAEHFEVPRHTAQGWATRLRRSGYQIGRS